MKSQSCDHLVVVANHLVQDLSDYHNFGRVWSGFVSIKNILHTWQALLHAIGIILWSFNYQKNL